MRAKDNPAARPPGVRPAPFTAAEDDVSRETPPVFQPQAEHELEEADDNTLEANETLAVINGPETETEPAQASVTWYEPASATPLGQVSDWAPIDTAPRNDPRHLIVVRWSIDDLVGRVVSYKLGRRFNGRRWETGGRWVSGDLQPLPYEDPIEWLRPPDYVEPESEPVAA